MNYNRPINRWINFLTYNIILGFYLIILCWTSRHNVRISSVKIILLIGKYHFNNGVRGEIGLEYSAKK